MPPLSSSLIKAFIDSKDTNLNDPFTQEMYLGSIPLKRLVSLPFAQIARFD